MPKYTKLPIEIEATQWFKDGDHPEVRTLYERNTNKPLFPAVSTLEGSMRVSPGDWIITGIKGEHYPCKDDIFRATYKEVSVNPCPVSIEAFGRAYISQKDVDTIEEVKKLYSANPFKTEHLISEKKELDIKIDKLSNFMSESPIFETIGAIEQAHLESQLCVMQDYSCILERRIKR